MIWEDIGTEINLNYIILNTKNIQTSAINYTYKHLIYISFTKIYITGSQK